MSNFSEVVLVACEESQAVVKAFRGCGITAFSCDTDDCSGGLPEWHLKEDIRNLLEERWGMIIAFPPCTHICSSGARWFKEKIADGRQQEGIDFFMLFANNKCKRVCIENPVGIMSNVYRPPSQIIQPWQFGHLEQKATCLWLRGLPHLKPTKNFGWGVNKLHRLPPSADRSKLRSKTYSGIAKAMADQWGKLL